MTKWTRCVDCHFKRPNKDFMGDYQGYPINVCKKCLIKRGFKKLDVKDNE